jgi:hypothetical protein
MVRLVHRRLLGYGNFIILPSGYLKCVFRGCFQQVGRSQRTHLPGDVFERAVSIRLQGQGSQNGLTKSGMTFADIVPAPMIYNL